MSYPDHNNTPHDHHEHLDHYHTDFQHHKHNDNPKLWPEYHEHGYLEHDANATWWKR